MNRRGAALATVLLALTLVAGVVAAAFFPALEASRAGINSLKLAQATVAAEGAVDGVLARWSSARYDTLPSGDSAVLGSAALNSRSGWSRTAVYPLSSGLYLVRAEGYSRDSMARREVSAVLQTRPFEGLFPSSLVTPDSVGPAPSFLVVSTDSVPDEWADCLGIGTLSGPVSRNGVVGATMVHEVFTQVVTRARNTGRALRLAPGNYVIEPQGTPDRCDSRDLQNWGDPRPDYPCHAYVPIVEASGDITLSKGVGQGVLIVHGGLVVKGDFRFFGVVYVDGPLTITAGTIFGGVLTSAKAEEITLHEGAIVYSNCALAKASQALGTVDFLDQRAWFVSH